MQNKLKNQSGRKSFRYRDTECLNCGQPLDKSDVYCPYCSQLNSNKQLTLKDFISEFVSSIVVYDSRLRNTIKDLLFRPGVMTQNYMKGERMKYANPFRFFLSVSIIYFLLSGLVTNFTGEGEDIISNFNDSEKGATVGPFTMKNTSEESEAIPEVFEDKLIYSEKELDTMNSLKRLIYKFTTFNEFHDKNKIENSATALDSLKFDNSAYNRFIYKKVISYEKIKTNPTAFINYMFSKTPFFLFFFSPIFALFFLIIYRLKKFGYVAHVIFIFHIFSFLFLAMILLSIPDLIFGITLLVPILFLIIGPIYFYKALRNFYGQNRFITILKFVFLSFIFSISASFAALLFFTVTAAIY